MRLISTVGGTYAVSVLHEMLSKRTARAGQSTSCLFPAKMFFLTPAILHCSCACVYAQALDSTDSNTAQNNLEKYADVCLTRSVYHTVLSLGLLGVLIVAAGAVLVSLGGARLREMIFNQNMADGKLDVLFGTFDSTQVGNCRPIPQSMCEGILCC